MANIMNMVNGKPIEDASVIANAVRYDVEQIRSEEEKARARANIGIEGGGGVFFVPVTFEIDDNTGNTIGATLGKTAGEIIEAAKTMQILLVDEHDEQAAEHYRTVFIPQQYGYDYFEGAYFRFFMTAVIVESIRFTANSADDYPSWSSNG